VDPELYLEPYWILYSGNDIVVPDSEAGSRIRIQGQEKEEIEEKNVRCFLVIFKMFITTGYR
jgi:hypothetical protein